MRADSCRRSLARLCLALAVVTEPASAALSDTGIPELPAAREGSVEIIVVGSEEDLELVRSTLGPTSFGDVPVAFRRAARLELRELLESRDEGTGAAVRAWLDLSKKGSADLYFADQRGERFLLRSVALPEGLTALAREALGQVLELSVRALIEDRHVGMTREETEKLLGAPAPRSPPEPRAGDTDELEQSELLFDDERGASLGAAAFYAVRFFGSEVNVTHGPGLLLGWVVNHGERQDMFWIALRHEPQRTFHAEAVGMRWSTTTLEGGYGLLFATGLFGLDAGGRIGGGVDFTNLNPGAGAAGAGVVLTRARLSTAPVFTLSGAVQRPLGKRVAFTLEAFADFYPVRVHYDLETPEGRSRILNPNAVRPGALVSLFLR